MRIYLDGQEIDHIPELDHVSSADEWMSAFMKWLVEKRGPDLTFEIIIGGDTVSVDDGNVLEMWIPAAPPLRAQSIGGLLRECKRTNVNE